MSSLIGIDYRGGLDRDFGCVPVLEDDVAVRIDEVPACRTAEQSSRGGTVRVGEDVPGIELFLEISLAAGARESSVEGIEFLRCGREDILVPVDRIPDFVRVHGFEHSHKDTVNMVG